MSSMPAPVPAVNPETAEFWAATAEGKLLLRRCNDCGEFIWYPRTMCPECWSLNTEWYEAEGTGSIYSYTHNFRGEGPFHAAPYVLAYVELTEGPRIVTNIITDDPESLAVGDRVRVIFDDTGEGSALYRFEVV